MPRPQSKAVYVPSVHGNTNEHDTLVILHAWYNYAHHDGDVYVHMANHGWGLPKGWGSRRCKRTLKAMAEIGVGWQPAGWRKRTTSHETRKARKGKGRAKRASTRRPKSPVISITNGTGVFLSNRAAEARRIHVVQANQGICDDDDDSDDDDDGDDDDKSDGSRGSWVA
jgi:hypothetical protein